MSRRHVQLLTVTVSVYESETRSKSVEGNGTVAPIEGREFLLCVTSEERRGMTCKGREEVHILQLTEYFAIYYEEGLKIGSWFEDRLWGAALKMQLTVYKGTCRRLSVSFPGATLQARR